MPEDSTYLGRESNSYSEGYRREVLVTGRSTVVEYQLQKGVQVGNIIYSERQKWEI